MSFHDLKCFDHDPELSGRFFRVYELKGTPYVLARIPGSLESEMTVVWATRRAVMNSNTKGRSSRPWDIVPFQTVFDNSPKTVQEQLLHELNIFLET